MPLFLTRKSISYMQLPPLSLFNDPLSKDQHDGGDTSRPRRVQIDQLFRASNKKEPPLQPFNWGLEKKKEMSKSTHILYDRYTASLFFTFSLLLPTEIPYKSPQIVVSFLFFFWSLSSLKFSCEQCENDR